MCKCLKYHENINKYFISLHLTLCYKMKLFKINEMDDFPVEICQQS